MDFLESQIVDGEAWVQATYTRAVGPDEVEDENIVVRRDASTNTVEAFKGRRVLRTWCAVLFGTLTRW